MECGGVGARLMRRCRVVLGEAVGLEACRPGLAARCRRPALLPSGQAFLIAETSNTSVSVAAEATVLVTGAPVVWVNQYW